MNTMNSISSRRNLDTIEVIINIQAARRAINFRIRSLRVRARRGALASVPSLIITFIRDEDPKVSRRASIFSPRTLIKTQGDWGDKREEHEDDRMLVRYRSSSHSTNTPNVIPLSVHNEDDETCRGCVIESRSMCSRSNGALRKV